MGPHLYLPESIGVCDTRFADFLFFCRLSLHTARTNPVSVPRPAESIADPGLALRPDRSVIPAAVRVLFRGSGAQPFWGKGKEALCGGRCVDGLGELTAGGWIQFCSLSALGGQQQREVG